jgi:hypothetical protein
VIGETIGRYRVVEKLGRGGIGRSVAFVALPPGAEADAERRPELG